MKDVVLLQEVGRVLSGVHEQALRQAISVINAVLAKLDKADLPDDDEAAAKAVKAKVEEALREADISFNTIQTMVSDAVRAKYPGTTGADGYINSPYVIDVFDDYAVYRDPSAANGGGLFKVPYSLMEGKVILGDTVAVMERREYVPISEAAGTGLADPGLPPGEGRNGPVLLQEGVIPLVEGAVRKDGTIPLRIVKPGWGSSGYYPAELLKEQASSVFPKGTKMFWDHQTEKEKRERPERSLRDLAAETVDDAVWMDKGPRGPGVYANAKVFAPYREAIDELAPHIGTSLVAYGEVKTGTREGRKGPIVESFVGKAASVDFVTTAGAGGEVISLFEAARNRGAGVPDDSTGETDVSQEELQEAQRALAAEREKTRRLQEASALRDARDAARDILLSEKVPDLVSKRLLESAANLVHLTDDGDLDKSRFERDFKGLVEGEMRYLQSLMGVKRNAGGPRIGSSLSESGLFGRDDDDDSGSTEESLEKELTEAFRNMGLSESQAALAARGR
jgi:hypothetical protein